MGGVRLTASRSHRGARVAIGLIVTVLVAALTVLAVAGAMTGGLSSGKLWPAIALLTIVLVTAVVGLVVAGHQPGNPIGWILAGEGLFIVLSVAGGAYANLVYNHGYRDVAFTGPLALVLDQLFSYMLVGFPLVTLLFPDGRPPSRRWRWAVQVYLAIAAAVVLATSGAILTLVAGHHVELQPNGDLTSLGRGGTGWADPLTVGFFILTAAFWLAAVGRQALSWRRADGEHRQQLKWLACGAAVCGVFGTWAITTDSAIWEGLILGFAALPLSIGLGIMKYRLYDIDRIISRTLAYALITGLLLGVYAGLVLLATQVLRFSSPVAVAASTLAAAALFAPVRRRVQRGVDRRFNRARYNADQMVAAFAARLQDTVDSDSVRDDLTLVVQRALEPAHVSVWVGARRPGELAGRLVGAGGLDGPDHRG